MLIISDAVGLSGSVGLIWLKNHELSKTAQNFVQMIEQQNTNRAKE